MTCETATTTTTKKKKEPRSVPPPRFAIGQVVCTKTTVRVRHPGPRGRKFLRLLRGTLWEVREVSLAPNRWFRHRYTLETISSIKFRVERKESQLYPFSHSAGETK